MVNFKPVKIMFDLDDEHQVSLYNYLKARTNGSSYIRSLIHQDLNIVVKVVEHNEPLPIHNYEVVKEHEPPKTTESNNVMRTVDVPKVVHHPVKVNITPPIHKEDEIILDGLF